MPVYTYHCDSCDHEFEKYQSFSEDSLSTCPECGKEMLRKVYKPALVVFKGSGYYVTDTKSHNPTMDKTNGHKKDKAGESSGENSETKSEKKKTTTETKPESKSEKRTTKEK